jgi:UDPglucose 6-dehydrogenase
VKRRARIECPRVGIVGLGYMGLATGLAFAAHGATVFGYDIQPRTRSEVASGLTPYREVGLESLLRGQIRLRRFEVTDTLEQLVARVDGIFLCVPTPSLPSGRIDLRPLKRCAEQLGDALKGVTKRHPIIVVKSTVVPGTAETLVAPIVKRRRGSSSAAIDVAANPEFLAEGSLVNDALHPSRVVFGATSRRASAWLRKAYRPFDAPMFELTPSGAELVKYAANAFLALKVSFANETARLADQLKVDVDAVMAAVGQDPRIGKSFLRAGPGFGGSCFEKDVRALVVRSKGMGVRLRTSETALRVNREQLAYALELIRRAAGPVRGKTLALLGLSFKAGTDDVRESRALLLARELVIAGAEVRGHDPVAMENFRTAWADFHARGKGKLDLQVTVEGALRGADAAILQADWPMYVQWPSAWSRIMRRPLLVDLRRALDPRVAKRAGLTRVALGAVGAYQAEQGRSFWETK